MIDVDKDQLVAELPTHAGGVVERPKRPRRTRRPSEAKRLGALLKVVLASGARPKSIEVHDNGGFLINLDDKPSEDADPFESWLSDELACVNQ